MEVTGEGREGSGGGRSVDSVLIYEERRFPKQNRKVVDLNLSRTLRHYVRTAAYDEYSLAMIGIQVMPASRNEFRSVS